LILRTDTNMQADTKSGLSKCALCGGTPHQEALDNSHFRIVCGICHNETAALESAAVADAVWNHLQGLFAKNSTQPILPKLPASWVTRMHNGEAESQLTAMGQEIADWCAFAREFREASTVDRRLAGYDRLVNFVRSISAGRSWAHIQDEAKQLLSAIDCDPKLTHAEDVQRHMLLLIGDLMRFESVLTPEGKAEMYASSTGPYVWFDHVVSTISAPLSAHSRRVVAVAAD
jgi:hypothetical protein